MTKATTQRAQGRRISFRKTIVPLTVAAGLGLAACGGGGDDSGSKKADSQLSKAQLATKMNTLCRQYSRDVDALGEVPNDFETNSASAAGYLDKLQPLVEAQGAKIKALQPADSIASQFREYTKGVDHQLRLLRSARAKAHAKDPSGLQDIVDAADYKTKTLSPLIKSLGFTKCLN